MVRLVLGLVVLPFLMIGLAGAMTFESFETLLADDSAFDAFRKFASDALAFEALYTLATTIFFFRSAFFLKPVNLDFKGFLALFALCESAVLATLVPSALAVSR